MSYRYSTSAPAVATVNDAAVVSAVRPGTGWVLTTRSSRSYPQVPLRWGPTRASSWKVRTSEAEWEYAARAGTPGDYGGNGVLNDMGWWSGNSAFPDLLHAVALKPPNAWGLYDMHGNVTESVNDWYSGTYYRDAPNVDPPGPTTGTSRMQRGGSWAREPNAARSGYRESSGSPTTRSNSIGFRRARTL